MLSPTTEAIPPQPTKAPQRHRDVYEQDATFEAQRGADDANEKYNDQVLLSIAIQPYMCESRSSPAATGSTQDAAPAATHQRVLGGVLAKIAAAGSGVIAATAAAAGAAGVGGPDPWFLVTSKLSAHFALAHSSSPRGSPTSRTAAVSTDDARPRIYRVRRSLSQLEWFRDVMLDKAPYSICHELPSREDAHTKEGIDQLVALLLTCSCSQELKQDPLLWCLLTQADDLFEQQVQSLRATAAPPRPNVTVASGGSGTFQALLSKAKELRTTVTKGHRGPPVRDLKPPTISDMLMETGVVDRALMTLDQLNASVEASYYFHDAHGRNKERLDAWTAAGTAAYDVRDAAEAERQALLDVADALRGLAFPSYWPWTRDDVMREKPTKSSAAAQPASESRALVTAASRESQSADTSAAATPVPLLRPPPTQRLTHYLHRLANASVEMGRLALSVFGDEFAASTNAYRAVIRARSFSSLVAHERLHSAAHQPKSSNRSLSDLQSVVVKLMAEGRGHDELDMLEDVDRDIDTIHTFVDSAVQAFESHFVQSRYVMEQRLLRDVKQMVLGQKVTWSGALLLLADLKTTLELDAFLDDEDLPFTDAPVIHNPSPQQRRRFDEQQEVWGHMILQFLASARSDGGAHDTEESKSGASGFRALFSAAGGSGAKRRAAFRDDADGLDDRNPFDTEPCEMVEAVGGGSASLIDSSPMLLKRQQSSASASSPKRRDDVQCDALPDELQEVVNSQSKFLLGAERAIEKGPEEAFAESDAVKKKSKQQWKARGSYSIQAGTAWGSVAAEDEQDPFQFE